MKAVDVLNHNGGGLSLVSQIVNAGIVAGITFFSALVSQVSLEKAVPAGCLAFCMSWAAQRGITVGKK